MRQQNLGFTTVLVVLYKKQDIFSSSHVSANMLNGSSTLAHHDH